MQSCRDPIGGFCESSTACHGDLDLGGKGGGGTDNPGYKQYRYLEHSSGTKADLEALKGKTEMCQRSFCPGRGGGWEGKGWAVAPQSLLGQALSIMTSVEIN